jgi:hypothetical protein
MQEALDRLSRWADTNKMALKSIPKPARIQINEEEVERVKRFNLQLGVLCQNDLKWNEYVDQIACKENKRLYHLRLCRKSQLPTDVGLTTYISKS